MANDKILEVKDLSVSFNTYAGEVKAVRGVTLHVDEGETVGVVEARPSPLLESLAAAKP